MARAGRGVPRLRVGLLAACALFALVAVGNGLDRQSVVRPSSAARVPNLFADRAHVMRGALALQANRPADALSSAGAAVRVAPVDPVSLALLGSGREASGDLAGADKAFRVAGQMGWRVPATQAYWMRKALEVGDFQAAALQLDAVLRQYPNFLERPGLLTPFEDSAAGRSALVARMASGAPWFATYAGAVEGLSREQLQARMAVLVEAGSRGAVAGCDAVAPAINRIAESESLASARSLWAMHCPYARTVGLVDPQFEHVRSNGPRTVFDWDLVGSADIGMVISGEGRDRALLLHSETGPTRQVLRQLVVLAPGRYRLRWQASSADGKPSSRIAASLGCNPLGNAPLAASPGAASGAELNVGGDCPAHWLSFTLAPGEGEVRLGAIALERLP